MRWDDLFSHVVEHDPAAAEKPVLPPGGGVYLLTDEHDRLVQLAAAADLRRAVLHRLSPPTQPAAAESPDAQPAAAPAADQTPSPAPRKRADLSQIVRRIRWQPTHSVFEATYEYHRIARIVLPETYLKNLAFGPAWFAHVDPDAAVPRFTVGKLILPGPGNTLGPFSTQQDANRFVQILEDVFDLCRYVHILEQVPHGQPCAYFEMGRCPAPCNASIPMTRYRETIARALRFAIGDRDAIRAEWQAQMHAAAGRLEFEHAAAVKQRLDRASEIEHAAFRFVRPITEFSWLILQRGGGRTRVKPFFVRSGGIQPGEIVRLRDLATAAEQWTQAMAGASTVPADNVPASRQQFSEQVWLVSHFLFRREKVGLFMDAAQWPAPALLAEMVREYFAAAKDDSGETRTTDSNHESNSTEAASNEPEETS